MVREVGTRLTVPLPEFPPSPGMAESSRGDVVFRRFGILQEDLAVDFSTSDRARLGTELLDLCVEDPFAVLPPEFFLSLSIGKRIECLLFLATGSTGASLSFPFNCRECGEELELELSLGELSDLQKASDHLDEIAVEISGRAITLRKASASDQAEWSTLVYDDEYQAAAGIVTRLADEDVLPDRLGKRDLEAIEQALDEADPLVNLGCRVDCPVCETANDREVDLFETAVQMLERQQEQAIVMVHRIASRYHWSEQEIFRVPERRRQQYLELLSATR